MKAVKDSPSGSRGLYSSIRTMGREMSSSTRPCAMCIWCPRVSASTTSSRIRGHGTSVAGALCMRNFLCVDGLRRGVGLGAEEAGASRLMLAREGIQEADEVIDGFLGDAVEQA